MIINKAGSIRALVTLGVLCATAYTPQVAACGGFFCQIVPINQAGEQIVFRQEADQTTAMIKIDYVGAADKFGWVLPVPTTPEISLGSDQVFTALELNTRPQFTLEQRGNPCPVLVSTGVSGSSSGSSGAFRPSTPPPVVIEKTLQVGPFDAQIVSSEDPEALATWLKTNNLDLTETGSSLLKPYIQAKSKFVVLKLNNNASVGSIRPIILKYASSVPVIPMTLTAVAAQNNMGVLVWTLGEGRGVPKNFKHVEPNYTRLNWYSGGPDGAYGSYQSLITQAMNEAGGQGFATDYAGRFANLVGLLPTPNVWNAFADYAQDTPASEYIAAIWSRTGISSSFPASPSSSFSSSSSSSSSSSNSGSITRVGLAAGLFAPSTAVQDVIRTNLPISSSFNYSNANYLRENFTAKQLEDTKSAIVKVLREQEIAPIENAVKVLSGDLYMTRLYTTLSANEMTVNPEFTFNTQMPGQPRERRATLTAACKNNATEWTLKLGAGTGREDELVIEAWQPIPNGPVATNQDASYRVEKTSANADPVILAQKRFPVEVIGVRPSSSSSSSSGGGSSSSSTSSSSGGGIKQGGSADWMTLLISVALGFLGLNSSGRRLKR